MAYKSLLQRVRGSFQEEREAEHTKTHLVLLKRKLIGKDAAARLCSTQTKARAELALQATCKNEDAMRQCVAGSHGIVLYELLSAYVEECEVLTRRRLRAEESHAFMRRSLAAAGEKRKSLVQVPPEDIPSAQCVPPFTPRTKKETYSPRSIEEDNPSQRCEQLSSLTNLELAVSQGPPTTPKDAYIRQKPKEEHHITREPEEAPKRRKKPVKLDTISPKKCVEQLLKDDVGGRSPKRQRSAKRGSLGEKKVEADAKDVGLQEAVSKLEEAQKLLEKLKKSVEPGMVQKKEKKRRVPTLPPVPPLPPPPREDTTQIERLREVGRHGVEAATPPTSPPKPTPEPVKHEAKARKRVRREEQSIWKVIRILYTEETEKDERKSIEVERVVAYKALRDAVVKGVSPSLPAVGSTIRIKGLRGKPEYNGKVGWVMRHYQGQACVNIDGMGSQDFVLRSGNYIVLRKPPSRSASVTTTKEVKQSQEKDTTHRRATLPQHKPHPAASVPTHLPTLPHSITAAPER